MKSEYVTNLNERPFPDFRIQTCDMRREVYIKQKIVLKINKISWQI